MGSTGRGTAGFRRPEQTSDETFGIKGAIPFKGKIPDNSGLEPVGSNKITLKIPATDGSNILFQFKLTKDNKYMTIIGYKNGVPEVKCKVQVDAGQPSLDKVMATGTASAKAQAVKMKDLFAKSTEVKEYQLGAIAQELLTDKQKKGEQ